MILKIRDADGNIQEVLALKGEKGDPGGGVVKFTYIDSESAYVCSHTVSQIAEMAERGMVVATIPQGHGMCQAQLVAYADDFAVFSVFSEGFATEFIVEADAVRSWSIDLNNVLATSGGAMTGALVAQANESYTTRQVRNVIYVQDGVTPPTTQEGDLVLFYK